MAMTKQAAEQVLSRFGITGFDWSKLNLAAILQIVQAILALFAARPAPGPTPAQVGSAGVACGPDDVDCIKQHFCTIKAVAECGEKCCGG